MLKICKFRPQKAHTNFNIIVGKGYRIWFAYIKNGSKFSILLKFILLNALAAEINFDNNAIIWNENNRSNFWNAQYFYYLNTSILLSAGT